MAELADARDSKSRGEIRVGSTPTLGTNRSKMPYLWAFLMLLASEKDRVRCLFFSICYQFAANEKMGNQKKAYKSEQT